MTVTITQLMVDSSALLQVKNTHHSDDSVVVIYSRSLLIGSNNHADVYSYEHAQMNAHLKMKKQISLSMKC